MKPQEPLKLKRYSMIADTVGFQNPLIKRNCDKLITRWNSTDLLTLSLIKID